MSTEQNQEAVVAPEVNEGEGMQEETVTLSKAEFDKLNQTLGSLKRDLKKASMPKEEAETSHKPEDNVLLEKAFLRTAGIIEKDEVSLALETAKKWGVSVDSLVDDEDFKIKLDKFRTQRANLAATSNVKGSGSSGGSKDDVAYWVSKGTPPTAEQVPDRATRTKIVRSLMDQAKKGKTFYND